MFRYLQTLLAVAHDEERGATGIEYGLLIALIAAVIVGVAATLGGQVEAAFEAVSGGL